jgi:CheY-like chemotaxis protein
MNSRPADPPNPTRLRILAVDDDPLNRSLVRAIIERAQDPTIGTAVLHEAGTLAEARASLAARPVDVVLLDVHLPDGLGLELAAELRERPPEARPAVIALTASVLPDDQQAALEAGCDAFLAKPYATATLVEAIGRLAADRARASGDGS